MTRLFIITLCVFTACTKTPKLKSVHVSKTKVESTVTTTSAGTVEAQNQAVLSFGVIGRVARISVSAGDKVGSGQLLAELENADLKIGLSAAQQELKRAEELFREGLVSKAALDDARRAFEVARVSLDRTVLRAPFTGLVTEVNLRLGESSQVAPAAVGSVPAAPIRIVDLNPRVIKGEIDELDLSKVKEGMPARVKIPSLRAAPYEALVSRVVPYVSTTKDQDRTSLIELKLKDTKELIPVGASADVEIVVASKDDALAVPTKLVLGTTGQRYVYRYQDGRIHKVAIETGVGNYDRSEVVKGLQPGDVVIYPSDVGDLRDDMKVEVETVQWP